MFRYLSLFLLAFLAVFSGYSQIDLGIGEWKAYLSHVSTVGSVEKDGVVYTITSGGMFAYDHVNGEFLTYSTVEGMSGIDPTAIHYNPNSGLVIIGYANGMIDYFSNPNELNYLTDISRNTSFTKKRIYSFASTSNRLYVGTDFGVVIYDLATGLPIVDITQIANLQSRAPVVSLTLYENRLWAAMGSSGLYSAPVNAANLRDPNIWRKENGLDGLPAGIPAALVASGTSRLYVLSDSVIHQKNNGLWSLHPIVKDGFNFLDVQNEVMIASIRGKATLWYPDDSFREYFQDGYLSDILISGNAIYFANLFFGLSRLEGTEQRDLIPDGPLNNDCIQVAAGNGELYIAPRGYDEELKTVEDESGIYYFNRNTGWKIINKQNGGLPADRVNSSFARALYDNQTGIAWLGSWGKGLVSLQNGEMLNYYDCENSGLSYIYGSQCDNTIADNTRVTGIDMDNSGNLWMTLAFARDQLVSLGNDGQWYGMPQSKFPGASNMIDLVTDDYGGKWIAFGKSGIVVYHDRNTPGDTGDDFIVNLTSQLNQGDLPSDKVFSLAKDQDGFIWAGTDQGVVVFYDPFRISQGIPVDAACPVFNFQCLLRNEVINTLVVDGGNRKWIGTNNGVFLVSEDGDEEIYHFTTDNSPLLSNGINDIAVDGTTGEVFIATNKGLISFRGDATLGSSNCDNLLVFPNPVFSDYSGPVTIQGSPANVRVKITTVSGMLVRELDSEGGTTTWDGLDSWGNRVRSGVYLALIADRNGENACIAKFSIIEK